MSDVQDGSAPVAEAAPETTTEVQEAKPEAPVPPAKRKYSYKADGEDVAEELDDAEITKRLSLAKSAMKRMSDAAKAKQQAESLIKEFHDNPTAVFKKLDAKKARSAAEEFLLEQIQSEMMSPEEKQRQEQISRLQKYEEMEKKQKAEAEAAQAAQLEAKYSQSYDKTISEALAQSGLPKVPATVKRMASLLAKNLELGLDLTPTDLVEEVKASYYKEFKELFGGGDASFILSMFGDDVANKIRKHDLAKLQGGANSKTQSKTPSSFSTESKKETKMMSRDEWREYLDKKVRE